jgi:hypothetical protein
MEIIGAILHEITLENLRMHPPHISPFILSPEPSISCISVHIYGVYKYTKNVCWAVYVYSHDTKDPRPDVIVAFIASCAAHGSPSSSPLVSIPQLQIPLHLFIITKFPD